MPSSTTSMKPTLAARRISYAEVMKMNGSVNRSAKAIYDLLDDLNGWVKTQMSWIPYEPTQFEAKARLGKNLRNLAEKATRQNISVTSDLAGPVWVNADENIFDILVQGLFLNALKFTPKQGCITVTMRNQTVESSSHSECVISITDTGNGIEKKEFIKLIRDSNLEKVLNEKSQIHAGLGLSIYRQLVKKSGGNMWSESEIGRGTTISFTVPTANVLHSHTTHHISGQD